MGLWKLTFPSYGAFKGRQTFLFSTRQIFCQNVLCHIVAMIVLKRLRIVTHFCAVSFSIKSLFCGTNNIFYSLENRLWDQTKKWFWKYIKNKGKVISESFRNFAHISSYLHLKSIAWKWDYVISKNTNVTGFIKAIIKCSCKVLLDTCNLTPSTRPVFLLKAVEF